MHARHLLLNRSSMPMLVSPGPTPADLELFHAAALRVPDHKSLVPYRLITFQGDELKLLGDIYYEAALEEEYGDQAINRAKELPLRAPMIITVVTNYQDDQGIPRAEQFATAACAAHSIVQAAFVQGYGAIWRTGPYAESDTVKKRLGIDGEDIVGFVYLGTPKVDIPIKPSKPQSVMVSATDFLQV
ncbi:MULTISPECIES: nitroreductase family protein [Gammaproteobacteria]|uniref:nitroreductase family protein n=1 Tax=Gammaproteobacteria TaxID=1236 RepID=UPI000DD008F9|nr:MULTISPECIES: nitroreductase family protein [Gammaproteobacteria]RTE87270.1 nitroreductase [Aliidiomarina sp. B3213]TCZ92943.1 nitroreductase [Lysobacter sp. N42]